MAPDSAPTRGRLRAAVFDLDGVVTFTARVHAAAWKEVFDAFLRRRHERTGEALRPFTLDDYRTHVDGRPRLDGVRAFLASRGIAVPEGGAEDAETVAAIAAEKDRRFRERLRAQGVEVDAEAVRVVGELRERGVRVGMATSSRNATLVLEAAGLGRLFQACVDGVVSEALGLSGKPAPDIFLAALERLGEPDPAAAAMFEDAEAGVEAGRAGGFGLVVGVDRGGRSAALREHGADWVIRGFEAITGERVEAAFREAASIHARRGGAR